MKNKKLIKIGWADAIENLEGWHTETKALDWAKGDDWITYQVGWILEETDDYILLSSVFGQGSCGRENQWSLLFKIPKPWVKYKREL